jgi:hypothetical protein
MASKSMNRASEVLARRHAAEEKALKVAVSAGVAVQRAQERRAVELARLDAAVADAERGADTALAVLASLVPADVAALLAEETPARVRQAQQRAPGDEVSAQVQVLTGAAPVRRRGRPPGTVRDRSDLGEADRGGSAGVPLQVGAEESATA